MGRKCFISFKTENIEYKKYIQNSLNVDMIDKSLNIAIDSDNEDYIMRKIREDYLSTSTVTIHLIGRFSAENLGEYEQRYIKRELQASLYNGKDNTRNGILGVVLPEAYSNIYRGLYYCNTCGQTHNGIDINDSTTIKEFSYNYYIPNNRCLWIEDDRYCVLVKWEDFIKEPEKYIEYAFSKRKEPIASKVRVRP
ncbi:MULTISPECIES: TIR domain-containing protein [Paenibacillus]|uniref:TIR domain-containing protein n=1 Tax=Paenibacillus TaxID=44249 RepID=UPI00096BE289|nr:TIR domain-containing protein [Paenibacillus odorifer]OME12112.1 molecular chaperone Tir [Paenibacillus odorifer]